MHLISQDHIFIAKLIISGFAALLLFFWNHRVLAKKNEKYGSAIRNYLLLICGFISIFLWSGTLLSRSIYLKEGKAALSFNRYIHIHEMYHYYMGAKYFQEIGYTGLYESAVIADMENGYKKEAQNRLIRDSKTKTLSKTKHIIQNPEKYKINFSAERWSEFKKDIQYFRERALQLDHKKWFIMNSDHGFNASPAWCVLGSYLANLGYINDFHLFFLSLIDCLLIFFMCFAIGISFGWQALCVCLIFMGTNSPADIGWTNAVILRYDWIFLLISGICLIKKNRMKLAGAAIAYSTLLRVFPGFILLGFFTKEIAMILETKQIKLSKPFLNLLMGAMITIVFLVPLSTMTCGRGFNVWNEFNENLKSLVAAPSSNFVGLQTIFSVKPLSDNKMIRNNRMHTLKKNMIHLLWNPKIVIPILLFGYIILISSILKKEPDWVAGIIGLGFIPILGDLSCYYYIFLMSYGVLFLYHPRIGGELCLLAFITTWLTISTTWFKSYYWMSFFIVVFTFLSVLEIKRLTDRKQRSYNPSI